MRIVLRMPGKSRGGRKGDANLSPRLSSHAQIRPHTCENVEVQRRGQYVGGEASVSATRESALFTFQEAFATLYTPRRAIICIPGANTPPMLRRKGRNTFLSKRHLPPPPPPPPLPPRPLAFVRKETGPKGNNGYGKTTKHKPLLH